MSNKVLYKPANLFYTKVYCFTSPCQTYIEKFSQSSFARILVTESTSSRTFPQDSSLFHHNTLEFTQVGNSEIHKIVT